MGTEVLEGYLKIMAVSKSTLTQGILQIQVTIRTLRRRKSSMSVATTPIMFYKYGGKQLYYNNTSDGQGEIDINKDDKLLN